MKKLTALVVIIFIIGRVYSQGPIFGSDQGNILYSGYKNKVEFGTTDGRPFEILIENGSLESDTLDNEERETDIIVYYLWPGHGRTTKVYFLDPSTKEPFDTIVFNVYNIPPATLYFGTAENGMQISKVETRLFAKYPAEIPLNVSFTMLSWELELMGRNAKGTGYQLDDNAQTLLKKAPRGSTASFLCKYKGPDNIVRAVGGVFIL
jgi:hypothetical protein